MAELFVPPRDYERALCKQMHMQTTNDSCHVIISNATIHLLHAGEENMKMYSPKSIIFPEGIARGEYDTRG